MILETDSSRTVARKEQIGAHVIETRFSIDPVRGSVTVDGHDGIVRFEGFESRRPIDDDWLADRAQSTKKLIVDGAKSGR